MIGHAACGDLTLNANVSSPQTQLNVTHLPPRFTNVDVECNTNARTLCGTKGNVADTTITLNTATPGAYTNLNDYNFLRSNKSIFPTFDNELILTPTAGPVGSISRFGSAVAIAGDGSTIAIGAPISNSALLSNVTIYKRQGNTWALFQQILRPTDVPITTTGGVSLLFGSVISLSYDGSIIAISAISPYASGVGSRPTYIFMYSYDTSSNMYIPYQQIPGSGSGGFGEAFAISANGKYLVASDTLARSLASETAFFVPSVWIYAKSDVCDENCNTNNQWTAQQFLAPLDSSNRLLRERVVSLVSAQNLALSADGTTIAFGCPRINTSGITFEGSVTIFNRSANTWQQSQFIRSSTIATAVASDSFGTAVALSADGTYLAVGDPAFTTEDATQQVFIFAKRGTQYLLEATIFSPRPTGVFIGLFSFGAAINLSADGTVLVIGEGRFGGVYIAMRGPDNQWTLPFVLQETIATNLGYCVACSADGAFVIAGAPNFNTNQSFASVFRSVGSFIPNDAVVTGTLCIYKSTTIDAALKVAGNIHLNNVIVTGTGLVTSCAAVLSDKRTKNDIIDLNPTKALEKLRALKPVTFFWKNKNDGAGTQQTGFVAQHMQKIFPHWVSTALTTEHDAAFLRNNKKYMITIKAELYAYLVTALEQLVQHNAEQNAAITQLEEQTTTPNA